MKKFNLNTILAILGLAAVFAPDVASVGAALAGTGIPWLGYVARGLGTVALLLASLPRIIGKARPLLAAFNLATPPADEKAPAQEPPK